jgi:hypothetical protein
MSAPNPSAGAQRPAAANNRTAQRPRHEPRHPLSEYPARSKLSQDRQ